MLCSDSTMCVANDRILGIVIETLLASLESTDAEAAYDDI